MVEVSDMDRKAKYENLRAAKAHIVAMAEASVETDWEEKYEILQSAKAHNDAYLEKCLNELRLIRPLNLSYYRAIENAVSLLKTPGNDDLVQGLLQDVLIDADNLEKEYKVGILYLNGNIKDKT